MSIQSDQSTVVECQYHNCDELGRKYTFHHGKFCSNNCETKHAGFDVLRSLKFDHCRCFTCFRELKTINPPKPDFEFDERDYAWTVDENGEPTMEYYSQEVTREAAVGFQFETEHSTKGEKQHGNRDTVVTGTICNRCGNTDHTHHDTVIADHEAIDRLTSLLADRDDVVVETKTLHRVYAHTKDLDLAVGHALVD